MALKTVINKTVKFIINASSDNALLLERINRAEDLADAVGVQASIDDKANTGTVIMIPEETMKELKAEETKPAPEGEGLPTPEEEAAMLKSKGMVAGDQRRQPGF